MVGAAKENNHGPMGDFIRNWKKLLEDVCLLCIGG